MLQNKPIEYDVPIGFQMLNGGVKKFIEENMRECLEMKIFHKRKGVVELESNNYKVK